MAKVPKKSGVGRKTPKYPSREKIKYLGVPKEYWDMLDAMTADGEEFEGRSVSFLGKLAVRAFLQARGKLDDKGRPIDQPSGQS